MPFIYSNFVRPAEHSEEGLATAVAEQLGLPPNVLAGFQIVRKGIDARRKPRIKLVYTVSFTVAEQYHRTLLAKGISGLEWRPEPEAEILVPVECRERIIIVGSGPAGLFAALRLADHGVAATVLERGRPVEERSRDVQRFWTAGALDPESNVQFGEGGAGTFSDGKLTCRTKDPLIPWILKRLTDFGAPPEIRYLAKPHIGTDRLRGVLTSLREYLLGRGVDYRFSSRMSSLRLSGGRVTAVTVNDKEELPCDRLILAAGHSARDTYEMLERRGVPLEAKPFAMGLRVEHPQELIDRIQYGGRRTAALPAADYAAAWNNDATGRSAYSFCMCPGGVVIAGASEEGGMVTNGMSGHLRNSPYANSALVVNVRPADFHGPGPLGGMRLQRHWEQAAFRAGGGGYHAPAQNMLTFLRMPGAGAPSATYRPGIVETDLDAVLPDFITATLREGIVDFNRRLKGFVTADATLIGIESRTSAPVRIPRGDDFQSIGVAGLYPAGEGAGYAGGIMSAAVDGVRIADRIIAGLR